jgi:hypothetical protein
MKMIKILQGSVVIIFVATAICGIIVFIAVPMKLSYFGQLIGILWPILLTMVVPALIGTPLTEAVRNLTGPKATQPPAEPKP